MGEVSWRTSRRSTDVAEVSLADPPATPTCPLIRAGGAPSALNQLAIVAIYELGQSDGQPYQHGVGAGTNPAAALARGPIPPKRALHIAAMACARKRTPPVSCIDLKPEPDGVVRRSRVVADFKRLS
jgi:hypothetical protein